MFFRYFLIALVFGIIGVVAGVIGEEIFRRSPPVVVVEVHNASDKKIIELQLRHSQGVAQLTDIAPGVSSELAFYVPGESGYRLRVIFADQQVLEGGAGYVQSGSRWSEVISGKEIKSKYVGSF